MSTAHTSVLVPFGRLLRLGGRAFLTSAMPAGGQSRSRRNAEEALAQERRRAADNSAAWRAMVAADEQWQAVVAADRAVAAAVSPTSA